MIINSINQKDKNSNTTLVKVKYFNTAMGISGSINSNTTLVKVK